MTPPADTERDKNHRFPGDIISHGVWLSYRFTLSDRDVQELLFARGITVSHEAIRQWCRKFGQDDANRLRCRRPQPGDQWHLEQDHRAVKRVTRPMLGFKSFEAAPDILVGIELMHMIKKRQMVVEAGEESRTAAELFYSLAT
jgi:transposase-like protein